VVSDRVEIVNDVSRCDAAVGSCRFDTADSVLELVQATGACTSDGVVARRPATALVTAQLAIRDRTAMGMEAAEDGGGDGRRRDGRNGDGDARGLEVLLLEVDNDDPAWAG
jgi:hypothetical protein